MNQLGITPDLSRCPLCGQNNRCAMEQARLSGEPQPACWCSTLVFDPALHERIPVTERGKICLCLACAEQSNP